jgi:hypothetical protein
MQRCFTVITLAISSIGSNVLAEIFQQLAGVFLRERLLWNTHPIILAMQPSHLASAFHGKLCAQTQSFTHTNEMTHFDVG